MESKNVWAGLLRDQGFVNCIAREQVLQHYDSTVCLEILNWRFLDFFFFETEQYRLIWFGFWKGVGLPDLIG